MQDVRTLADALRAQGAASRHRRLLVLQGDRGWAREGAVEASAGATLWLARSAPGDAEALFGRASRGALGRGLDTVVVDLHDGLDPEAVGAAVGAVRAGGLLVLLLPRGEELAKDPLATRLVVQPFVRSDVGRAFVDRFLTALSRSPSVCWLSQGRTTGLPQAGPEAPPLVPAEDGCWTSDQSTAVTALTSSPEPVVLVSDRGRGKSSALGLAAAALLAAEPTLQVTVTGPGALAVQPVFERAAERGAAAERLRFARPDVLLTEPRAGDLLLVDEAAALPVPALERLLATHPRVAFATTVHGYEGTGRGFALRFRGVLDRERPGWREVQLQEPIRWASGDPVEAWAFDALLLAAEAAPARDVRDAAVGSVSAVRLERAHLAADEHQLRELFGLLVLAHYRTTPTDLRRLLDAPNLEVFALKHGGHVVAAALVAREGGFDEAGAEVLCVGRERPRGHMLPEVLATQLGRRAGATLTSARVVRIAVHPALWGRGLGSCLLGAVAAQARADGASLLGTGFGVTERLVRFWRRAGLAPVRLGLLPGAASGVRSIVMLQGLDPAGRELPAATHARFGDQLPDLLGDPLRGLDPELALRLLDGATTGPALDAQDRAELFASIFGPRVADATIRPVFDLVRAGLADRSARAGLTDEQRRLLLLRVVQRRRWPEVAERMGVPRDEAMRALRVALMPLARHYFADETGEAARRYGRVAEGDDGA